MNFQNPSPCLRLCLHTSSSKMWRVTATTRRAGLNQGELQEEIPQSPLSFLFCKLLLVPPISPISQKPANKGAWRCSLGVSLSGHSRAGKGRKCIWWGKQRIISRYFKTQSLPCHSFTNNDNDNNNNSNNANEWLCLRPHVLWILR